MADQSIKEQAEKYFDTIFSNLKIQNHIVQGLSKSRNSKQALEKAEHFKTVIRQELIDDICQWYTYKKIFPDEKKDDLKQDVMVRINGELAKMGLEIFTE